MGQGCCSSLAPPGPVSRALPSPGLLGPLWCHWGGGPDQRGFCQGCPWNCSATTTRSWLQQHRPHYSFWHELLHCVALSSQLLWSLAGEPHCTSTSHYGDLHLQGAAPCTDAKADCSGLFTCAGIKESLTQQCSITAELTGLSQCHGVSWQNSSSSPSPFS